MIPTFSTSHLPGLDFGCGVFQKTATVVQRYGQRVLLVTGGRSFQESKNWSKLQELAAQSSLSMKHFQVMGEPSPQLVDSAVQQFKFDEIDVVLGIGGGSALDAAKAIAGLLRLNHSVMDFLEGVGPEIPYPGPAVPFIALPTTAGTGSEMTKNAVLSVAGKNGFKKSFRDEKLMAQQVLLDPDLLSTCPAGVIAANGMDALTQLLESYVSIKANPFTDALALSGMLSVRQGLIPWFAAGHAHIEAQTHMAYASMLSGITLAQVGLGSVHGLASPLGAFFPIPHGVVCGTLVAEATRVNIQAMLQREPNNDALSKYAHAAEVLCGKRFSSKEAAWEALMQCLQDWKVQLGLPGLGQYGVSGTDVDDLVKNARGSSMKTNPIELTDEEIGALILSCL
ncbi:MAG: iron-containing alcohol dehydrogenase [Gammaproteobacteria bacterium]|nr:iron-containing alcohol dehydrogenase [Gammaproteobacteria bacterium]MDH5799353.1 iron-containing alcohol dehydrogenase [Gammaproteobacteria bacterium]